MIQVIQKSKTTPVKFQTSEQLWFWFLYTRQIRNGFSVRNQISQNSRVCELLDIETMITKLYLSGKLNDKHLTVMKQFGDKRRAPHQDIWAENAMAAIWSDAMEIIGRAARTRGWIE